MREPIVEFMKALHGDAALKTRLAGVLEATGDADVRAAVIGLARAEGYAVTLEDLDALGAAARQAADHRATGVLSDAELEEVNGGFLGAIIGGLAIALGGQAYADEMQDHFDPANVKFWLG